jgi:Domain of unknown function (DUF4760)
MTECISSFTFWETIAKLAPIGTAIIALIAAGTALVAIWVQMHLARRRASIDFFLKTEMDETAIKLYNRFKEKAPTITFIPHPAGRSDYNDVRTWLNICELISVGVNRGAFSETVSFDYWVDVIQEGYQTTEGLIRSIRNTPGEGSRQSYIELEKLAKRWAKKAAKAATT